MSVSASDRMSFFLSVSAYLSLRILLSTAGSVTRFLVRKGRISVWFSATGCFFGGNFVTALLARNFYQKIQYFTQLLNAVFTLVRFTQ